MQLDYTASQHVRNVIAALGRTEDLKVSPSDRRLAIAGFAKNKIAVFDICIAGSSDGKQITLTDGAEIYSTHLNEPHGLDFLDEETIIVTNRGADTLILKLPRGDIGQHYYELTPLEV